jgi:hypothetical protein
VHHNTPFIINNQRHPDLKRAQDTMSSLVAFVKLCWAYPWLLPALVLGGFVAYKALGRRWRLNRQIARHRL